MFLGADREGEVKPFWTPTLDKSHELLPILLSDHFFFKTQFSFTNPALFRILKLACDLTIFLIEFIAKNI